ncbi:MAG: tryptophan synthase subunit alpha [Acidobacteria bacterium]|nr:tryptophan synthase subunit alpha [Acidobacteriota bacterium]
MSRRLDAAFAAARAENRAALIVFLEAGDPSLAATQRLVRAVAEAGADIVELGVPFSDPIADGPVIQRASERALVKGTSLAGVLDLAARLRKDGLTTPLVLFSYANPLLAMGEAVFAETARRAGIDGVLVTDLPPEEGRLFVSVLRAARLAPIFLVAPSSPEPRLRKAASQSRGFLYAVSRAGVTGARAEMSEGLPEFLARVKASAGDLPVAVGFGISTAEQVAGAAKLADGVVVGSAVVRVIEEAVARGEDPVPHVTALVSELRRATVLKQT